MSYVITTSQGTDRRWLSAETGEQALGLIKALEAEGYAIDRICDDQEAEVPKVALMVPEEPPARG